MGDFTPTTEQVVSAYVWAVDMDDAEAREEEVRRWLAQHDESVSRAEREAIAYRIFCDAVDLNRGFGYQQALKDVHGWVTEGRYDVQ